MENQKDKAPLIVLFDGHCNLCSQSVQFVLKHERAPVLHFASLQSEAAKSLLEARNFTRQVDSILFIEGQNVHAESGAALRLARFLRFPWPLLRIFLLVPPFVRNAVYRFIARNRYRWFGHSEACFLPSEAWKNRFL